MSSLSEQVTVKAQSSTDALRLRGRWLFLARSIWIIVALLALVIFVVSIPAYFAFDHLVCATAACAHSGEATLDYVRKLQALGISLDFFATYSISLYVVFTTGYFVVGGIIFWRKSDDRMALFASFFLVTFALAFNGNILGTILPALWLPTQIMSFFGSISIFLFFYLFPDGRFAPRWSRWLLLIAIVYWGAVSFFPHACWNPFARYAILNTLTFVMYVISMVVVLIYRYRRVSNAIQRQQTKWVVFGMSLGVGGFLALELLYVISLPFLPQGPLADLVIGTFEYVFMLLIPLSISFAILRSRLFAIDIIINRTLVYGTLTASVIVLYVVVVGGLSALFQTRGTLLISLLATGLVAVLFQPLRTRLQRSVNRLVYGERDDPYTVISRLGQRLEASLAGDAVLPTIVETVAQALNLPYVGIIIKKEDAFITSASFGNGEVGDDALRLPLMHQSEQVGELVLAPRAPGEKFTPADLRLLHDLAHEAGVAIHAVRLTSDLQRLTDDLQRSRERIVVAREEARRRLRRDLHDDLAPTLAALALTASTVGDLIPGDPAAAIALVNELENEIRATVGNIRRLVYELRPPTLDELGLIAAIRERAAQYDNHAHRSMEQSSLPHLQVVVNAPDSLPQLSAAAEVAAYRIVQEALTNVERHAQAYSCLIRITLNGMLQIEVIDDGIGLPAQRRIGVGLLSIRERAEELGGSCVIEKRDGAGTRVYVQLPVAKDS